MRSQIHDGQRNSWTWMGVSQVWKTMVLTLCCLCASAGFALAVTGNLEPPPGEATNLNTGVPLATTPTLTLWANRLDGFVGQAHRFKLVMGGEAVLDREIGLVWERSPKIREGPANDGQRDWAAARFQCMNRKTGGGRPTVLPLTRLLTFSPAELR